MSGPWWGRPLVHKAKVRLIGFMKLLGIPVIACEGSVRGLCARAEWD